MKLRIGCAVVGFFSLILSLGQLSFAQAPNHLTLSGAAFVCADQPQTGNCSTAEFDTALGAMLNAQGTWAANVFVPDKQKVVAFTLCGQFNEEGSSITATLYSTPLTASNGFPTPIVMATVQSKGASDQTQCFKTTQITDETIDNGNNQYYVVVTVPDNDGVIFTSVRIGY